MHLTDLQQPTIHRNKKKNRQNRILTDQFLFELSDFVSVLLCKGDIVSTKSDVIVCPQDEKLSGNNRIAKAIHDKTNQVYDDVNAQNLKHLTLRTADILPLKASVAVHWKYIFHAVPPRWGLYYSKNDKKFSTDLQKTVTELLRKTGEYAKVSSVAIPLMGISADEKNYPTPVPTCVRSLLIGIKEFCKVATKTLKIEIYTIDDGVLAVLREIFGKNATDSNDQSSTNYQKENTADNSSFKKSIKSSNISVTQQFGMTLKDVPGKLESCCICMDDMQSPKSLKCGHTFCKECIDEAFKHKPACPACGVVYGIVKGNQPVNGTIRITEHGYPNLAGYESYGHIKITYDFPSGIQGPEQPEEGKRYKAMNRSAYLPNNVKGRLVANLLKLAFKQRLVFTIGDSRTIGEKGVITWNDLHHKTRMEGGPQRFGYPDETYLDRVLEELAAKGITKMLKDMD